MILVLDLFTVFLATILLSYNIKKIIFYNIGIIDLVSIVYYFMQVLPLLTQYLRGITISDANGNLLLYNALIDEKVAIEYDVLCISTVFILYFFSYNGRLNVMNNNIGKTYYANMYIVTFIRMMSILPILIGFICCPNKDVYLTFSYFYNTTFNPLSKEYLYHTNIMSTVTLVSCFFFLLNYFFSDNNRSNKIFTWICLALCTWIDGKRTLMVIALLGILAIDYLKQNYHGISFMKRGAYFLLLIVSYFICYGLFTNKGHNDDWYINYSFYFNRLNVEKLAIYDKLYTNKMLQYTGQTILFNLFFFIPRTLWPDKPGMYCKYFTGYAYNGDGSHWVSGNYQVNIWGSLFLILVFGGIL